MELMSRVEKNASDDFEFESIEQLFFSLIEK